MPHCPEPVTFRDCTHGGPYTEHGGVGRVTPGRRAAHASTASLLWELGCRAQPSTFDYSGLVGVLDQASVVERPLYLLLVTRDGRCDFEHEFGEWSPLHDSRWPGYPPDWTALWQGRCGRGG